MKSDPRKRTPKRFSVITLFPELIESYLSHSILKRGIQQGVFIAGAVNPRDFTADRHHKADDRPYGGGPGMVLKAEPILRAVDSLRSKNRKTKYLIMSPRGKEFTNAYAKKLAKSYDDIVLIAGHYEGVDVRVKKALKAEEISVGPYTVTGGEMPALMIIDATARQIPGVLGKFGSLEDSRISSGEMYTRPETFVWKKKNYRVPAVLRSGHHAAIDTWRMEKGSAGKKAPNLKKR